MQPTYGRFALKGIAVGLLNSRVYSDGEKEGGHSWNRIQFGVKVSSTSIIYVELMGSETSFVKKIYRDPLSRKLDRENSFTVPWEERYKVNKNNYNIYMPIKVNLHKEEQNRLLTPYDAVKYIREHLKDGDSVLAKGSLQITEYQGRPQEKFSIQEMHLIPDHIDFSINKPVVSFQQEIVFVSLESINLKSEKYGINSYIIYKKNGDITHTPYKFVVYGKELFNYFNEHISYGSTVQIHGYIKHYAEMVDVGEDQPVINGMVKELEITGGNAKLIALNRYSEKDFVKVEFEDFITEEEATDDLGF